VVSGTASSGLDYTPLVGSVTIATGQSSATIQITPVNDSLAEAVETVVLTLTAASGYTVGATDSATLTLTDDDTPGEGDEPADAVDDQASTDEETAVNIDVLANDLN